jgi:hypothetical protein
LAAWANRARRSAEPGSELGLEDRSLGNQKRALLGLLTALAAITIAIVAPASAQQPQKSNILIILSDAGVVIWNIFP